jgi:hypothetical protein
MRWCAWPGERLLKRVQQEVNGNSLDEYHFHATSVKREYRVAPNKLTAWRRCVGQEEPLEGFVRQRDWAGNGNSAEAFRVAAAVNNGMQTPTASKSSNLELFVPLGFWYNTDVRLAVPSVSIPHGQRFINIDLATASEMVGLVPRGANLNNWAAPGGTLSEPTVVTAELYINNIFVNPEVHKIYIKRIGFSLIRVHKQQITPMSTNEIHLQGLKWPIEYLFVGAKVRDYFAGATDALRRQYLDVWDHYSVLTNSTFNTAGQSVMYERALVPNAVTNTSVTLGVAATTGAITGAVAPNNPTANVALPHGTQVRINGALFTVDAAATVAAGATLIGVLVLPIPANAIVASNAIAQNAVVVTHQGLEMQMQTWTPIIDTLSISAHSIDLYREFPAGFFNAYTPYHYGGENINAPKDVGALFVPFCLFPGTYQPSGHINVSRAREFYLKYTSTYQANNPSVALMLVVIASAINFLLISDGSAVLRYST